MSLLNSIYSNPIFWDDDGDGGGGGDVGGSPSAYAQDEGEHGAPSDSVVETVNDDDNMAERLPEAGEKKEAKPRKPKAAKEPKEGEGAATKAEPKVAAEPPSPSPDEALEAWRKKTDEAAQRHQERQAQQPQQEQQHQQVQQHADPEQIRQQVAAELQQQIQQQIKADPVSALTQLGMPPQQIGQMLFPDEDATPQVNIAQDPLIQQMQQQMQQMNQAINQRTEAYQQELQRMQEQTELAAAQSFIEGLPDNIDTARLYGESAANVFRAQLSDFEGRTGMRATTEDKRMLALDLENRYREREWAHLEKLAQSPFWADKINLNRPNGEQKAKSKTLSNNQDDSLAPPKPLEEMSEEELHVYGMRRAGLL